MHYPIRFLTYGIMLGMIPNVIHAEEFRSPDGVVSFTIPDPKRFRAFQNPPLIASWENPEQTLQFDYCTQPNPKNFPVNKDELGPVFLQEFQSHVVNGKLVYLVTERVNGLDILTMTCAGTINDVIVTVSQKWVTCGGTVYKIIVSGVGVDTRTNPDAEAFFASFQVLNPQPQFPAQLGGRIPAPPEDDATRLSRKAGQAAGAALMVALLVFLIQKLTKKKPRHAQSRPIDDDREGDDDLYDDTRRSR